MYVYNYNVFDLFSADQSFKDYISMRCWLGIAKLSSAYCHSVLIVTGTTSGHTSIVSMSVTTRSVPPYHHTPWGLSSWQSDWSTLTACSGYGGRSTWCALTACFTAMAPSCHSPQGFQAWAWPAHPYNSFLAYETGPRLLPGSCPMPLLGQGD